MQSNSQAEAKRCAENAINNGDHWLLHTIISTKNTTILQEVLTSTLIMKHNIISTQKAIAETIIDIKQQNTQANNKFIRDTKKNKFARILYPNK